MHASKPPFPGVKYKRIILKLSGEILRGGKSGDPITVGKYPPTFVCCVERN